MRAFAITADDVGHCPEHRLDVAHYREDGTCRCGPRAVSTVDYGEPEPGALDEMEADEEYATAMADDDGALLAMDEHQVEREQGR